MTLQPKKSQDGLTDIFKKSGGNILQEMQDIRNFIEKDPGQTAQIARDLKEMYQHGASVTEYVDYFSSKLEVAFNQFKESLGFSTPAAQTPTQAPAVTASPPAPAP